MLRVVYVLSGSTRSVALLHECRSGWFSLACDVVEELRAPVVDRFVLRLVNRREFGTDMFERNGREVLLNDDGRRKFLVKWDANRMSVVNHRGISDSVQVGELPLIQSRLLARYFRGETDDYIAYIVDE